MPRTLKTSHVAIGAAAYFVAFLVVILGGQIRGPLLTAVDDIMLVVVSIAAALASARTVTMTRGRTRAAWAAVCFGLTAYAAGQVVWAYLEIVAGEKPFPSLADVFFLIYPAGACVGLLLIRTHSSRSSDWRIFFDGVIVAASLFAVSWALVMSGVYRAGASSGFEFALLMAYPIWDVVLVTVACVVMLSAGPGARLALWLLTLGLVAMALADSGYAYLTARNEYFSGNAIDIGWVAGLLLLTLAAVAGQNVTPDERAAQEMPGWAAVWVPFAPLMIGVVVVAAQPPAELASGPILPVGVLLLIAVLVRQFLAVSENRRLVETVAEQALHDPLTGLANRALFNQRLEHAMQLYEREYLSPAVVAVDLNDFKLVNDNLGHPVGDDLLIAVAHRLLDSVRTGDTVARLGGDEFAVLVEGSSEAAEVVGRRVVAAFEEPFVIAGHELLIRASVGLAIADPTEPGLSTEELLRRADVAMYSAKRSRASGVQSYHPEMQLADDAGDNRLFGGLPGGFGADAATTTQLLGRLRHAIDHAELSLVYQPKLDLRTGAIVGAEALLRWPQPDGTVLAPEAFLPLVRRHGLMGLVTRLVIGKALDDALTWHRAGVDISVAVNLFAPSLANVGLPAVITQALAYRGLLPSALTVEITEELFLDSTERTCNVLKELRRNGIRIAIDDFGSGYSALSYLRDLPIDEVKLDRNFIAPILVDDRAAAVVRAVVDLAHVLGLTVVVEGVEDADTAALVRDLGGDIGQGFFYGVPVPPAELLRLVQRRSAGAGVPPG
ncbi:bifunctional diguanylate cyclase/phosphodiesterase [Mycobacterium sp. shizuoka-1]|uniref:putative bifunctional diguanylate cyclase/phosphodiesterase n=1 Tax=Mycobacterium sp. shizuoka-1 TaxID=2039281 RepID=UPI000C05D3CA|nr:bifunctional diguanylate cyclase/phosphodiesterase [Mycobacterium sp. shizuoka-1]GAY16208.1 GGDEF-domain containing protein [Mycobacterium sp. shizuoka-1]